MVIVSFYNFYLDFFYKKHCVAISWSITVAVTRLLAVAQQLRNDYYDQIINQVDVDHMAESDEL